LQQKIPLDWKMGNICEFALPRPLLVAGESQCRPEGPALLASQFHQSLHCAAPSALIGLEEFFDPRPYGRGY
jgi:hypothetical protein